MRKLLTVIGVLVVIALVVLGVSFAGHLHASEAQMSLDKTPSPTASATPDPGKKGKQDAGITAQCRVDAIQARMTSFGLKDGDYVIGEDRIDTTMPAFTRAGSLAFGKNGQHVTTRKILAEVFASDEVHMKAVTQAKLNQLIDQYPREVILNADNWEIVQYLIPTTVTGNTGLDGTTQVSVGNTESEAGDAEWLFVDPKKCVIPTTNFDSMGNPVDPATPENDKPVASVRPGCTNPNDGHHPSKDWSLSVARPIGVTPEVNDQYEPRPDPPAIPAPVIPADTTPPSSSQAPGATVPDPARVIPPAGTGTTQGGTGGSVNPPGGTNNTDPGNPFG